MREYDKAIENLLVQEEEWNENPREVWGLPTGLECFDIGLGGLHGSQLSVWGARPAHGKTTFANQIAFDIAQGYRKEESDNLVFLCSPEMTTESILMRMACNISGISSRDILTGKLTHDERILFRDTLSILKRMGSNILITAGREMTITDIEAITHERDGKIKVIFIDYITQIRGDASHRNRYEAVGDIAARLRRLALDYDIPVVALSQLSRDVEKDIKKDGKTEERPPVIADLRESGRIEEIADVVGLLQRQKQSVSSGVDSVPANFEIAKNRHGPIGFITMKFDLVYSRFEDIGLSRGLSIEGLRV